MLFRMFGTFGRKKELHMIDDGLRSHGVVSNSVPEAVKLAFWSRVRDHGFEPANKEKHLNDLAAFLAFLCQGFEDFSANVSDEKAKELQKRLEQTLDNPNRIESEITVLALHAGIAHDTVATVFSLEEKPSEKKENS